MASIKRTACPSLQVISQIEVVKLVHKRAAFLEREYIEEWSRQLSDVDQVHERKLNIRGDDIDTAKVVSDYLNKSTDTQNVEASSSSKDSSKADEVSPGASTKRKKKKDESKRKQSRITLIRPAIVKPGVTNGIPTGADSKDYILYRKCKLIEDIRAVREYLAKTLTSSAVNDLMSMVYNMSLYNTREKEFGLLTLQSMLSTSLLVDFRLASSKLHLNFSSFDKSYESSIGTTILHYTFVDSSRLVHLSLERCCCDSLLKLFSQVAHSLKYLQISSSRVSDQGLLYLCGVEKKAVPTRENLRRACKDVRLQLRPNEPLFGTVPNYQSVPGSGCLQLEHLEAYNLKAINWTRGRGTSFQHYREYQTVPMDCGFVAVLTYLPKLRSLLTEVGGRSVMSYFRMQRKSRRSTVGLSLEVIGENRINSQMMSAILSVCRNLKELRLQWHESIFISQKCDEWVDQIKTSKLNILRAKLYEFKSERLATALQNMGSNLTILELKDLSVFRHSNFRAIKLNCPNLRQLTMTMTMNCNIYTSDTFIEMDKDANLESSPDVNNPLSQLERVHLYGPFGTILVNYLLRDATNITSLALGIEWLDATVCSAHPDGRSDYIGKEYLEEVLTVNKLPVLEELHLYAQYRRGRHRLTKDCAEFVMAQFPLLKHLGNFLFWCLRRQEANEIIRKSQLSNRNILFEEDLHYPGYNQHIPIETYKFEYRYIPDRLNFACNHIRLRKDHSGELFSILEIFPGGQADLMDELDSDDSNSDDDWSSDESEDDLMVNNILFNVDPEPVCVIM